jgi:hypothetical protein
MSYVDRGATLPEATFIPAFFLVSKNCPSGPCTLQILYVSTKFLNQVWLGTPLAGVKLPLNNNKDFSTTTTLKLYFHLS